MVPIEQAHNSWERRREGLGFLLIPCLITRPRLTPGQRPRRSHSNPSPRPTSKGPDYREEKHEVREGERQREGGQDGMERQRDERKDEWEGRWTEPEWKHILSVSELSGLCGPFSSQLMLLHWLSSALEGTSHVRLRSNLLHARAWGTRKRIHSKLFFHCHKNGKLIFSVAIKPGRQT